MKELTKLLSPLSRKLFWEKLLNTSVLSLAFGGFVSMVLVIISKFVFIPNLWIYGVSVTWLFLLAGLIYSLIKKPSVKESAVACDKLGFSERFQTALENDGGPFNNLLMRDCEKQVKSYNIRKMYRIRPSRLNLIILSISLLALLLCGFTPSITQEQWEKQNALNKLIDSQLENIEEIKRESVDEVDKATAAEINDKIKALKQELKKAQNPKEAVQALEQAQSQLKRVENQQKENLKNAMSMLDVSSEFNQSLLERAMETLDQQNINEAMKEISDLLNQMEGLNENQLQSIKNQMKNLSGSSNAIDKLNQQLRDSAKNLSPQNASGNNNQNQNGNQSQNGQSQNGQGQNSQGQNSQGQNGQGSQGQNGQGNQSQQGQNGQGSQGQNGQGNQSQQGQNGQGNQGQGQNGQNSQGQNGQTGQGQNGGSGRGFNHIDNEMIYNRPLADRAGTEYQDSPGLGDGGSISTGDAKALGTAGELLPVGDVVGSYSDMALKELDEYEVPHGMKDIVKSYFSSFE